MTCCWARSWWWSIYPLSISFGVVYLGEHYVADAVAGVLVGLVSYAIGQTADRGRRRAEADDTVTAIAETRYEAAA